MRAAVLVCALLVGCDGQLAFAPDPTDASGSDVGDAGVTSDAPLDSAPLRCKVDADCPFATLHCEPTSGTCVPCLADLHCAAYSGTPRCDLASHDCVECSLDTDCGSALGWRCDAHRCLKACHDGDDCSGETPSCNPTRKVCTCTSSSCTSGARPRCDTSIGICVRCAGDADCSGEDKRCVAGACVRCTIDPDCESGKRCDPVRHECVD